MNKITEQEYNNRKEQIESSITLFKQIEEKYISITLDETNDQSIKDQHGLFLDTITDSLYVLEKELQEIKSKWSMRDWTYTDYVGYNLAVNNID